jgi:cyclomaltodextrinase / maltogenic alpha-amylase / neopullulanase
LAHRRFTPVRFAWFPEVGGYDDRVELLGETSDWRSPIELVREADGAFARTIDLPPGVYQYKLRIIDERGGSRWELDPTNDRTRSSDGQRNSVVAVGGAPEPWLFAPAPPWVEELDRGGVRVLVGVRRSFETGISISWSENGGTTWSSAKVERAFAEDEHVFFTAVLPSSATTIDLALSSRAAERFESRWSRGPANERTPAWWKRATVYAVVVDRFRPEHDRAGWESHSGEGTAGGHLEGIRRSLPDLADLGIDTLYLTPAHVGASSHRYDLVDPLRVDPALGGEAAYEALIHDARARGMRIVQDVSFAHAGRGFPPYDDVVKNGRSSRWAPWFVWRDGALVHYGKRTDAPLLDPTNAEVQALALEAVSFWAKLGASGLRLDMTAEVPLDLGRAIRRRFRELVPDGVVLGEVVPRHAWRWRAEGVVDAATDFGFHEIVGDLVCRPEASAVRAFEKLARTDLLRGGDARTTSVRFVSTHDHPRLATRATSVGAGARVVLAYALLATLPGIPMLLYGEEHGLRSSDAARDAEDVWPDRMPMPWTSIGRDPTVLAVVRGLLHARRTSEALRGGSLKLLFADETTLVYRREAEGEVVDVAVSFDSEPKTIELEDDELPRLLPIAKVGGVEAAGAAVTMPPLSAVVARREPAIGKGISPLLTRRNLVLRDRDLASAAVSATARPSRFLFSVTERCNLRCQHCITHAPERTKEGTARTMTRAVLDAIAGDLAYGEYFAFVHGGESLTAPIFFDVLDAIVRARGGEPYVAHLLTNGVLLNVATAERLASRGVSSISVSLDGATAETNDAIRTGGRFHDVRENLRRVLAWRTAEGVDLRVGLSVVVLQQNVGELERIVDLGADLGVDWIKLEEGVPATAFARRSLVACSAEDVRAAVAAAMAHGRARGLVMVDHTLERVVWRCRLDDDTRAFLDADEAANRTLLHPCRTLWESVNIEPNGDVRAGDFFGHVLGNVTQVPLAELWNAPAVQQQRRDAAFARLCGPTGPAVCVDAPG